MHPEAFDAVRAMVAEAGCTGPLTVVDIGGRLVNGSVRDLFHPACHWLAVDRWQGVGVGLVADGSLLPLRPESMDVALSTECLEHDPDWPSIVAEMAGVLRLGGVLMLTAACDPRLPHSAIDGWDLRPGESYANVDPDELGHTVTAWLGQRPKISTHPRGDVYCWGVKS